MELNQILIFGAGALLYSLLFPGRWRGWVLMIASVFAVYWLQPALPIRYADYFFPSATLALSIYIWSITRKGKFDRADWVALVVTVGIALGVALTRYLIEDLRPTPSRPPRIVLVLWVLAGVAVVWGVIEGLGRRWKYMTLFTIASMIAIFVVTKAETLAEIFSEVLRGFTDQDTSLASMSDIQWLGFSYLAFRLIHMLRDRQTGKLPDDISLREHLTYVIFFPALTAGPIDRAERFLKDMRALPEMRGLDPARMTEGLTRISIGIFKKFVIADSLADVALNATNAEQVTGTWALWVVLYAYAIRLFLDFSGYSDIAIGLGYLFGIRLPENFDRPYLKTNITTFWQSWHMTLSNWARFYVFSPLSRNMLRMKRRPHPQLIVLTAQMSTMVVIGLWHGITVNFFIWGVWHGIGLYIHKYWTDRTRKWYRGLNEKPRLKTAWSVFGVLVTFHFVVIGWVWFSLPDFELASDVFLRLWGIN